MMGKVYILIRGEYPLYASLKRKCLEEMTASEPDYFGHAHIIEVPIIDEQFNKGKGQGKCQQQLSPSDLG